MKTYSIILTVVLIIAAWMYYQQSRDLELSNKIIDQNLLARDSLETFIKDSTVAKQKYVLIADAYTELESKNKNLADLSKKRGEKILTLTSQNIELKRIIAKGEATVLDSAGKEETDPFIFPEKLVGRKITFGDTTKFYSLSGFVKIQNPKPSFGLSLDFYKNIWLDVILTRNKEGKWSSYSALRPDFVNEYLIISDVNVTVAKDEWAGIEENYNKFRLTLIPNGGLFTDPEKGLMYGNFGLNALINRKHEIEYKKGIGNNFHLLNYGYAFDIIK